MLFLCTFSWLIFSICGMKTPFPFWYNLPSALCAGTGSYHPGYPIYCRVLSSLSIITSRVFSFIMQRYLWLRYEYTFKQLSPNMTFTGADIPSVFTNVLPSCWPNRSILDTESVLAHRLCGGFRPKIVKLHQVMPFCFVQYLYLQEKCS